MKQKHKELRAETISGVCNNEASFARYILAKGAMKRMYSSRSEKASFTLTNDEILALFEFVPEFFNFYLTSNQ